MVALMGVPSVVYLDCSLVVSTVDKMELWMVD